MFDADIFNPSRFSRVQIEAKQKGKLKYVDREDRFVDCKLNKWIDMN